MKYSSFKTFVVRKPLSSIKEYSRATADSDISATCNAIKTFFANARNSEALFLASPDLYARFQEIKDKKEISLYVDVYASLYKYMARMTNRATPFGMLSGCGVGNISEGLNLQTSSYYRHLRFEMNYLFSLFKELSKNECLRDALKYYPNNSMYRVGEKTRYLERKFDKHSFSYFISEFENEEFTDDFFNYLSKGISFDEVQSFFLDLGFDRENVVAYITELVENEIIIDSFYPTTYGDLYEEKLLKALGEMDVNSIITLGDSKIEFSRFKQVFQLLVCELSLLSTSKKAPSVEDYKKIFTYLDEIGIQYSKNKILQCDLFYDDSDLSINTEILKKIRKCINIVAPLSQKNTRYSGRVEEFKKKFLELYEYEEIQLLKVLDSDYGIGYGDKDEVSQDNSSFHEIEKLLFKKVLEARDERKNEIQIEEKDVEKLEYRLDLVPSTFTIKCALFSDSSDEIFVNLEGMPGLSTATSMIGRFTHGSERINALAKEISKKEADLQGDEKIIAELHHITESRVGNILSRKDFRPFEIPFLAFSHDNKSQIIDLSDIYISLTTNNEIRLRSKKMNKEILPVYSHAHNYKTGSTQPVYQFLGDLQYQFHNQFFSFSWGRLSKYFSRLPRVKHENHILYPAMWLINQKFKMEALSLSYDSQLAYIREWRKREFVPQIIDIVEGDNKLPIDLENSLSIYIFLEMLKKPKDFFVEENLNYLFEPLAKDEEGNNCAHEMLVFYHKDHTGRTNDALSKIDISKYDIKRHFYPGSEWIYFKIYCGQKAAQRILLFIDKELNNTEYGKNFFFVRYADPEFHLRIRFRIENEDIRSRFIVFFYHKLYEYNKIHDQFSKLTIDTYSRELERYHPLLMVHAENIFINNSQFVIGLLNQSSNYDYLQLMSLKYVDMVLNAFEFDLEKKLQFASNHSTSFKEQFGLDRRMSKYISLIYEKNKININKYINQGDLNSLIEFDWNNNFKDSNDLIKYVLSVFKQTQLQISLDYFVSSVIHMFINRLFTTKQNYEEMVIYHLLTKYYKAKIQYHL